MRCVNLQGTPEYKSLKDILNFFLKTCLFINITLYLYRIN